MSTLQHPETAERLYPHGTVTVEVDWWRGLPTSGWFVYRLFDRDRTLLYVGMTSNLRSRIRTHARDFEMGWFTVEAHPDRAAAVAAERAAIAAERPTCNVAPSTGRFGE